MDQENATPPVDVEALIAKAKAATHGPWLMEDPLAPDSYVIVEANKETYEWRFIAVVDMPDEDDHDFTGQEVTANAEYIAAASPNVVIALCEEIKRLRASSVSPAVDDEVLRDALEELANPAIYNWSWSEDHAEIVERVKAIAKAALTKGAVEE